jgi:hypothetical protein
VPLQAGSCLQVCPGAAISYCPWTCCKGVLPLCTGPLPEPAAEASAYFEHGGRQQTPAYLLSDLTPGHVVEGPVLLIDDISTIVVRCSHQG